MMAAMIGLGACGTQPASSGNSTEVGKMSESERSLAAERADSSTEAGEAAADDEVKPVEGLSDDFMMGADISSVIAELKSGVVYQDQDGKKIDNLDDFVQLMADNGITHIRVRVWNDPYDSEGHGYGGGDNDVDKAKLFADAARKAKIHMMADFHCSDFWADPAKQRAPKAWEHDDAKTKRKKLKKFIRRSLEVIDPGRDTVDMVQVGNETTTGIAGEQGVPEICRMINAGAAGVRAYSDKVKVVVHVTDPQKDSMRLWAEYLEENKVDYDALATSYYPYWHGSYDLLREQLLAGQKYGREVFVAETSYAGTLDDSDGTGNTVARGSNETGENITWPFTVQGQARAIRDLIEVVSKAGGTGVFYWEPAWITVGDVSGMSAGSTEYADQVEKNKKLWEERGSGWASSYAGEYGEDEKNYFGGSAVDNQAMFTPDGKATAALGVWKEVRGKK